MSVHQTMIGETKIPLDGKGNEIGNLTEEEKSYMFYKGIIINTIYSVSILIFGTAYKTLAVM